MSYNPILNEEIQNGAPLDNSLLQRIKENFEAQQIDLISKQNIIDNQEVLLQQLDASLAIARDLHNKKFCELYFYNGTTFAAGTQDRIWHGSQGNGISLVSTNGAQIRFTKSGSYLVTVHGRLHTDVWQKWGIRSNNNAIIAGESAFTGGGAPSSSHSFIANINDISQDYKLYTVCGGNMGVANISTPAGNIGHANKSINATITEIKLS